MKKLLTILLLSLTFPLLAGPSASVGISISGNIFKFITISTSQTSASLDLNSDYDTNTGSLNAAEYELSLIGVRSNVRDGYVLKASTANNFKLVSDSHAEIEYSLNLEDAVHSPASATFTDAHANNDPLLSTTGSFSFIGNKLTGAELILTTEAESDFTLDNENFSDTITLTVIAN